MCVCVCVYVCIYVYLYMKAAHVAEDFSPNENDKAMERIKKLGPGTNKKKRVFQKYFSFLNLFYRQEKKYF